MFAPFAALCFLAAPQLGAPLDQTTIGVDPFELDHSLLRDGTLLVFPAGDRAAAIRIRPLTEGEFRVRVLRDDRAVRVVWLAGGVDRPHPDDRMLAIEIEGDRMRIQGRAMVAAAGAGRAGAAIVCRFGGAAGADLTVRDLTLRDLALLGAAEPNERDPATQVHEPGRPK